MSNQARPVLFTNMQMRARKRRRIHRCKACRREEAGISYEKTNGNGWGKPYVFDLMSFFYEKGVEFGKSRFGNKIDMYKCMEMNQYDRTFSRNGWKQVT
jgi:hypothetical protein